MMLKTSSRRMNPFLEMLKHTLKKNLGIIILLCIAALLYCPGTFIINIERNYELYTSPSYVNSYMFKSLMYVVAVCAGIIVTLLNFMNFSFLYQKRSSDLFHAFPLTRTELLVSRMISGIIITVIPVIMCYTSFGIMSLVFPWLLKSVGAMIFAFFDTLLIILVCSAFSMIFVVCAGSLFDLIVSFVGANGALLLIGVIINLILEETLVGYNYYSSSDLMKNLSPLYACGVALTNIENVVYFSVSKHNVWYIIRFIVYIAAFTAASILLYKKRKAEKGGQAYAYKFIYVFCSILAGICGGYLLGMLFAQGEFDIIFWVFSILGALIVCAVYGAITDRGFKQIKKSLIYGGIASVIMPIIAIIALTGCFGFTNRVPNSKRVQTAVIGCFSEEIQFDNPQEVTDIHKKLLASGAIIKENDYLGEEERNWINFTYTLKNGNQMKRRFTIVESKAIDVLLEIYKKEERITNITDALENFDSAYMHFSVSSDDYNLGGHTYSYLTKKEAYTLLDFYTQDLKKANSYYITNNDNNSNFYLEFKDSNGKYHYFCLEFSYKFENTYNYLRMLNLTARQSNAQYIQFED